MPAGANLLMPQMMASHAQAAPPTQNIPPQVAGRPSGPSFARPGQRTIGYPNGMPAGRGAGAPLRNRPVAPPAQTAAAPGISPNSIASQETPTSAPANWFPDYKNPFAPRPENAPRPWASSLDFNAPPTGMGAAVANATPQNVAPQQRRGLEPPTYNMGPMEAYTQYLQSEPERGDYKTGKFGTVINALTAGLEAKDRGLAAGVKLGEELRDRPYQEEYKKWATRGNKQKAAVDLENARYNAVERAYSRDVDNARQQQQVNISLMNAKLAREKFEHEATQDDIKMMTEGWQPSPGNDGKVVLWRMSPVTGQPEYKQTQINSEKFSAAQQLERDRISQEAQDRRTKYTADTSSANTAANIRSRESEGNLNRELRRSLDAGGNAALSGRNTAAATVKNEYPELDNAKMFGDAFTVTGNRIRINPKFTDDQAGNAELANYARTKFPNDPEKQMRFVERFKSLRYDALRFVPLDEDEE
jgi:hypothetical protein